MCELQVAPGGLRQVNQLVVALHAHAVDMGERSSLGMLGVAEQGGGGGMGQGQILGLPGQQAGRLELGQQAALAQAGVKLPVGPHGDAQCPWGLPAAQPGFKRRRGTRAEDQLAGADAQHPLHQLVGVALGQMHLALRHAEPGQAAGGARALVHGQQERLGLVVQQFHVGQRAGGDHPYHLALHRPLASRLADLFADGHRFALLDEPGQVGVYRVKRYTRHAHGLPTGLPALGQGDVEQAGRFLGVGIKKLVEVTHAVEEQGIGIVHLEPKILLHHGGVLRQRSGGG